jgi:tetratricopeptide (TPR) repeat protein
MTQDNKKSPVLRSSNQQHQASEMPLEGMEQALEEALLTEDYTRVLEILDSLPRWTRKQPELMSLRATALLAQGDSNEALQILRDIERKNPRFLPIYPMLAMCYFDLNWHAHALQAAQHAFSDHDLDEMDRTSLEDIIKETTEVIQSFATELGLSFETMQRACILNERAQMAMNESKLNDAEYFSREALKIAPNWNAAHNNRAQCLYFSGKAAEAIAVLEAVLVRDAGNAFALSCLVKDHFGLNQPEQAQNYANRLSELSENFPADSMEIEYAISALALVEDTPALWKIAQRFRKAPSDTLLSRSWYSLAVAAVRMGKWKEALKLIEKVEEENLPAEETLRAELKACANRRQPRLDWMPPSYPGAELLLSEKAVVEWDALLEDLSEPLSLSQRHKVEGFFQRNPFVMAAIKRLLWDETAHQASLQSLTLINTPEANAEILRFALSQTGSRDVRVNALLALIRDGHYSGPKIVKIWDDDLEEWKDIELNTQRIGDIKVNAQPKTIALINKAIHNKNLKEAISLLRKAVEMEPTSPTAIFNLGVKLVQNGETEEGEALIYHSVEVDPDYSYGHASIALSEVGQGHEQEALDHLGFVTRAEVISPETAVVANLAWCDLAIRKHDLKSARQRLDMAAQISPNNNLVKEYEKIIKEAEEFEEKYHFLIEFQQDSAKRSHKKLLGAPLAAEMGLHACLEMNSKDMLVGSAHLLRISTSGKKGELTSRLADYLLEEEFLQRSLENNLVEKERSALQWVMEAGGVRPWKEFIHKYGDDMEESTSWDFHEPESIPGRLRRSALFYSGMLDDQQVAFIPADVRPLLKKLLK